MAKVVLRDVSKEYEGGIKVVDHLSLEIDDGSFVVLVGPSGCGKSTTLRMVAGLEELTGGTIQIGDRVVNDVAPKDRDVAMVFQSYALYPHMTVAENLGFSLKVRGRPKAEVREKVQRTAELLGIADLLTRKPKALSGGQRQRVALGRAIVREPQCFLFDEPLSNLDAKLRVETRAELKELHHRLKSTTIYVTHDQEEAMTLGDRVVVMNEGVMQQHGPALEVYRFPKNRFVAGFLGNPPMNFLTGTIVNLEGRLFFQRDAQRLPVPDWALEALGAHVGNGVILGARPEALSDARTARFKTEENCIPLKVDLLQPLGDRIHVSLTSEGYPKIVALVDSDTSFETGGEQPVFFDLERVHFFETLPEGRVIAQNRGSGAAAPKTAGPVGN